MSCSIPRNLLHQFLQSVSDFYRLPHNQDIGMLAEMAGFLDRLVADESRIYPQYENRSVLPAIHHFPVAVQDAGEKTKEIANNLNQLTPFLDWKQTSGYEVLGEHYLYNYGYSTLIGPGLLIEHDSLKLGFGLWGPDLYYPKHHHAAEECYHVLGNEMQLKRQDEDWKTYYDGDAIYNAPWVIHELKALNKPMFLLYTWRGDVAPDAILI